MTRHRRARAAVQKGKLDRGPAPLQPPKPRPSGIRAAPDSRAGTIGRRLIPFLLIGVGLAAYSNSFHGAFVFDDRDGIIESSEIRHLWPPWEVVAHSSRPLVQLSLAVNYALGGLNVWGYHAFNLAVHLLSGLVLFAIVRRTLGSKRLQARYGRAAPWLGMAVAAIWLVHPLQTESVTYIIQRAESLMGLFYLLTLYCGIRGVESPHPRLWFIAAVSACALGMGTKEVMVSAPLVMLLYDRVFLADSFTQIFRRRRGLYLGLAATWGLLGALLATSGVEKSTGHTAGLTPWRYALTQFSVIVHYLRLSVWPRPLVLDYAWPLAGTVSAVVPWAAVVAALLGGTVLAFRRLPLVGFLGAWFFLILSPTSSILPLADVAFEHRMYLPLAAVVALVVIGGHTLLATLLGRWGAPAGLRRWLEVGLVVVAVAVLGYATLRRNEDYRSELVIWRDTVAKQPTNFRAHFNLGTVLYRQEQVKEAAAQYAEVLRLKPGFVAAHFKLGNALYRQGQLKEAAARYAEALRLSPNDWSLHINLGLALEKQGQLNEAVAHFAEAVRIKPDLAVAHYDLANALYRQGRVNEAIARYTEALRLKPDYPEAHNNLATALASQGQLEQALAHYTEAVRLNPDYTEALNNLRRAQAGQQPIANRP